jgi:hypothetical protein
MEGVSAHYPVAVIGSGPIGLTWSTCWARRAEPDRGAESDHGTGAARGVDPSSIACSLRRNRLS